MTRRVQPRAMHIQRPFTYQLVGAGVPHLALRVLLSLGERIEVRALTARGIDTERTAPMQMSDCFEA